MPENTPTEWLFEITTEDAVYLVDLDQSTIIRLPAVLPNGTPHPDAAQLREDGQPIPLLSIGRVHTGLPMVLGLGIREDGTATIRVSTPVQSICAVAKPGLEPAPASSESITHLHPTMTGSWMVHTITSNHLWNLDEHTVTRIPGPDATPMPYDNHPMVISNVVLWPQIGTRAYVMCQDPDDSSVYQWRICATITAITAASDETPR